MDGTLGRPPPRPWLHLALFLATAATTLRVGFGLAAPEAEPLTVAGLLRHGWPYATALLGILAAHEFGHYGLARWYRVDTSLPYFIPFPWSFGTFGAVIRMRDRPPSRRATLDIGVAGPIAGFLVALPLLLWGTAHSTLVDAATIRHDGIDAPFDYLRAWVDGRLPSPWALLQAWREGRLDGTAAAGGMQYMGDSLVTWLAQRLVWGDLPPGQDLLFHPVAFAAWLGMLVTTLNLVPLGQLDGGHLTYALLGRARAEWLSRLVSWGLLGCFLFLSWGWLGWWLLTRYAVGPGHPPSEDEGPLDPARVALAVAGLVLLVLTFVPVPFAV
jgi:membrane-associated protease RseP (regulator of RpoE activity)